MLFYFEGTVMTAVMMTGVLAQKTITATSTLSEMTPILKPRCLKWMKRNAANFERLRCFIPKHRYKFKMPMMMGFFFLIQPFIAHAGEGYEVPGWAWVWETTQKARAEHSGTGRALQGQTTTKGIEFGSKEFLIVDVRYRNQNSKSIIVFTDCRKKKRRNLNVKKRGRRKRRRKLRHGWKT